MIYFVSTQTSLFNSDKYEVITVQKSLDMMKDWDLIQFDVETSGKDPHLCKLLCAQFGNDEADARIVVDCTTVDIVKYKELLESKLLVGQNLKFDLQHLYNHKIIPRRIYDTMIVEQMLYLGYPSAVKHYSLKALAEEYLGINIDKTVRGEIIWRGLDDSVILYAAGDVTYLEQIMHKQMIACKQSNRVEAAKLECCAVPVFAYMEWCGIYLDVIKWKEKMIQDQKNLENSQEKLNQWVIKAAGKVPYGQRNVYEEVAQGIQVKVYEKLQDFVYIDPQGDLFTGFDLTPKVKINWSSSQQVVKVAKILGFNTKVKDKKTGENKDSVLEKHLTTQKGIADDFLSLYLDYQGYAKVVSSFGQTFLDAVNPKTGRIHTNIKQLGASSGRTSCGGGDNDDLAKYKKLTRGRCKNLNLQQIPADSTRECFTAPTGYKFVSADFSGEESRLAADIYQDKEFIKEFLERSGDMHSLFAWVVFNKECRECGCKDVSDVKKLAPQWRKKVKSVEFAWLFGAAAFTISQSANCSVEEAQEYIDRLEKGFAGVSEFAKKGSEFVRKNGYIVINPLTGHRITWYDHNEWLERQKLFTPEFWDEYKLIHKGTGDYIASTVREHFQAASKWDRMARNSVTQGTGAIILKRALTMLFNWIVDNNYFNIIQICIEVHDEINCYFPDTMPSFPKTLETIMEAAASEYCKTLPIPAEASVGDHWIH